MKSTGSINCESFVIRVMICNKEQIFLEVVIYYSRALFGHVVVHSVDANRHDILCLLNSFWRLRDQDIKRLINTHTHTHLFVTAPYYIFIGSCCVFIYKYSTSYFLQLIHTFSDGCLITNEHVWYINTLLLPLNGVCLAEKLS